MTSDTTSITHSCEIAVIGGGCSGLLVTAQLLRRNFSGRIIIVESRTALGHGLAYSTPFEEHLLNVPAGNMSAFQGEPSHFLEWLKRNGFPDAAHDQFLPRKLYGTYLEAILETEIRTRPNSVLHICAQVTEIETIDGHAYLTLSDGSIVKTQKTILALGNPASNPRPELSTAEMGENGRLSPWHGEALRIHLKGQRTLLVGAGLTAVDSALALQGQDATCKTYMVSRRAILPQVHDLTQLAKAPIHLTESATLQQLLRLIRHQIRTLAGKDIAWRSVIDAFRPMSNQLWQDLSLTDRTRFLRHLKPYWETHRHRMAPTVHEKIRRYIDHGSLSVIAGRLRHISSSPCRTILTVEIALRGGGERRLEVDRVINCSGVHENYNESPRPLIRSLIRKGLGSSNDLGLGFRTNHAGALVDANRQTSSILFTLGPPRRGELFETTAVPEIRLQAEALAIHLIDQLRERQQSDEYLYATMHAGLMAG